MKLSILGMCVLLAGSTAFAAPAQKAATTKAPSGTAPASPKAKMLWATGSIEKYDATSKMLTVKEGGKEVNFLLIDQTHVMKGKETLMASSLTTGQHAKIQYAVSGANKEAHVIEVTDAKPAPAKK